MKSNEMLINNSSFTPIFDYYGPSQKWATSVVQQNNEQGV